MKLGGKNGARVSGVISTGRPAVGFTARRTSARACHAARRATSRGGEAPAGVKYRFARARHQKLNLPSGATRRVESRPEMAPKLRRGMAGRDAPTCFRRCPLGAAPIFADARIVRRRSVRDERRWMSLKQSVADPRSNLTADPRSTPRRRSRGNVRESTSTFVYARKGGGGGGGGEGRGGRRASGWTGRDTARNGCRVWQSARRARAFSTFCFTHRSAARPTCTSPWTTSLYDAYLALAARRAERGREEGRGEGNSRNWETRAKGGRGEGRVAETTHVKP